MPHGVPPEPARGPILGRVSVPSGGGGIRNGAGSSRAHDVAPASTSQPTQPHGLPGIPSQQSSTAVSIGDTGLQIAGEVYLHEGQNIVLTPSRLRTHSLSVLGWSLGMAFVGVFSALLYIRLCGHVNLSWWLVFVPLFAASLLQVPVNLALIIRMRDVMHNQVGPPPAETASVGMHLQYELILMSRVKTHLCDHASASMEALAHIISQALFAYALNSGRLGAAPGQQLPVSAIFAPSWVAWILTIGLNYGKDPHERSFITLRDIFYLFTIMVALKADGLIHLSWNLVFALPWFYFAGTLLLGVLMLSTLLLASVWRRWRDLMLPLGFCIWLLCNIPMLAATSELTQLLDNPETMTAENVLLPLIVACGLMAASGGLIVWGMLMKERLRERLIASGAVWTAFELMARRLAGDRDDAHRMLDAMPEQHVVQLVQQMMAGKDKPQHLLRVSTTLYRRLPAGTMPPGAQASSVATPPSSTAGPRHGGASTEQPPPRASPALAWQGEQDRGVQPQLPLQVVVDVVGGPGTRTSGLRPHVLQSSPGGPPTTTPSAVGMSRPNRPSSARSSARMERLITGAGVRSSVERTLLNLGAPERTSAPLSRQRTIQPGAGHPTGPQPQPSGGRIINHTVITQMVDRQLFGIAVPSGVAAEDAEDDVSCVICYDAPGTAVFLECGHGGFCPRCARLVFVRPPSDCPACRQHISMVVELESIPPVGHLATVKQA